MSELVLEESCRCGATIKLFGWTRYEDSKSSQVGVQTFAQNWRKEHRCKNPYIKETRNA